jgi:predicted Zn-dependent protease
MKLSRLVLTAVVVLSLVACETTPVTGRKQLMLVSESQAISASAQAYTQTINAERQKGKVNTDPALEARVKRITGRLIPQAVRYRPETADWQWQVVVIDEPKTLNAWCMAGGRMAIYTGIINQLKLSDDEIAQVMGHEIAHALAKHTAERMSVAMASEGALLIGAAILGGSTRNSAALEAAAVATTVGVQLPNSRAQEAEADRIGIELAAKAGYDPNAAPMLWKKMIEATGSTGKIDWLSTHPAGEKRMESLAKLVPDMMPYYHDKSPRPEYKFRARSSSAPLAFELRERPRGSRAPLVDAFLLVDARALASHCHRLAWSGSSAA